jgi:hypothetical protein
VLSLGAWPTGALAVGEGDAEPHRATASLVMDTGLLLEGATFVSDDDREPQPRSSPAQAHVPRVIT